MSQPKAEFRWCRSRDEAKRLASLFFSNLTPAYISHSELQGSRALTPSTWSPDIAMLIENDVVSRINQAQDQVAGADTKLAAAASVGGTDVGVFLITFCHAAAVPHCIIEDMIVDPAHRDQGIGFAFIEWISEQSIERKIPRLFLESSIVNERAHAFFERVGFHKVSVVMMMDL